MPDNEAWMTDITSVTGEKQWSLRGVCSDAWDIFLKKKKNRVKKIVALETLKVHGFWVWAILLHKWVIKKIELKKS